MFVEPCENASGLCKVNEKIAALHIAKTYLYGKEEQTMFTIRTHSPGSAGTSFQCWSLQALVYLRKISKII